MEGKEGWGETEVKKRVRLEKVKINLYTKRHKKAHPTNYCCRCSAAAVIVTATATATVTMAVTVVVQVCAQLVMLESASIPVL